MVWAVAIGLCLLVLWLDSEGRSGRAGRIYLLMGRLGTWRGELRLVSPGRLT